MGTRSLTVMVDCGNTEIAVMYRQYDGYPTGHGQELCEFLRDFEVTNGVSDKPTKTANGFDCLAAQIIAHFKREAGNFYLYKAGTRDCGEEYIYTIYPNETGGIRLKVEAGAVTFFGLPGTKQCNMPILYDGPVAEFDAEHVQREWHNRVSEPINDFHRGQTSGA